MELYDVEEDLLDKADPIPDISRVSLNSSNNVGISHVGHQQSSNQSHGKSNSVPQRLLKSYPNHSSAVSDDSPTFFDRTKSNRQSNKVCFSHQFLILLIFSALFYTCTVFH